MINKKKIRLVPLILSLMILCSGCTKEKELPKLSEVGFYLDTVIILTAYTDDDQVLKDAMEECSRYEKLLSATIEGSDVWRINHADGQPVEVSDDTMEVLRCAVRIAELSGGAGFLHLGLHFRRGSIAGRGEDCPRCKTGGLYEAGTGGQYRTPSGRNDD